MAVPLASTSNDVKNFDPKFPAAVKNLQKEIEQAHVKTLSRLANLSVPVVGVTAKSASLDAAIERVLNHGETTLFLRASLFAFPERIVDSGGIGSTIDQLGDENSRIEGEV